MLIYLRDGSAQTVVRAAMGRKTEYPEKTPDDELQKIPLKPEDSSPKRDSNPHSSICGRLGKQTC